MTKAFSVLLPIEAKEKLKKNFTDFNSKQVNDKQNNHKDNFWNDSFIRIRQSQFLKNKQ